MIAGVRAINLKLISLYFISRVASDLAPGEMGLHSGNSSSSAIYVPCNVEVHFMQVSIGL